MNRPPFTCISRILGLRHTRLMYNRIRRLWLILGLFSFSMVFWLGFKWFSRPEPLAGTYIAAEIDNKRLGNAMFIYAALVGIATRLDLPYLVQNHLKLLDVFNLSAQVAEDFTAQLPAHTVYEEYGRRASAFDYASDKLKPENTIIRGYFQSWRYFRFAMEKVRKEFTFHPKFLRIAHAFLDDNPPENFDAKLVHVGIHVRRGDLLEDSYQRYGYSVADAAYFKHAMDHFQKNYSNIQFVVCSDDPKWAKEHIEADQVIFSEGHTDAEDLAILSLCDHTIISVGSFGWWAAWLANGTTIYYANWPREYTQLEYQVDKKTYFPPFWTPMS